MAALATAFVGGPASADTPEVFAGSAAGRALDIHVINHTNPQLDIQATIGLAESSADSTLKAAAKGTGELLPNVANTVSVAKKVADANTTNPTQATNGCDKAVALPPTGPQVLGVGIACGTATATVKDGLPVATSEASVAGLNLDGQTVLNTGSALGLDKLPAQLGDTLSGALQTVCDTLAAQKVDCGPAATLKTLVTEVLKTRMLDVQVAPATSSVTTTADTVTSTASAAGAVIKLLPLPTVPGVLATDPVLTIEVSSAKATVVYDRKKGVVSDANADPAIVRVKPNAALSKALNIDPVQGIAITPDSLPKSLIEASPLATSISAGGKSITDIPGGGKKAVADGVTIKLLGLVGESSTGAGDGGIVLSLSHAEAAVGGAAAKYSEPVPPKAELPQVPVDLPRGQLPRTGGPGPWLPMAGAVVLGLAVLVRRTVVRAR